MQKTVLCWVDVVSLIEQMNIPSTSKIFGVPKGGMILAGYVAQQCNCSLVTDPREADYIIDDLIDSGRTMQKYAQFTNAQFKALIDKREAYKGQWIVFPWEEEKTDQQDIIVRYLEAIGEDPTREGLVDTPKRVVRMWNEIFSGYSQTPADILKTDFDNDGYDEIVLLKNIEVHSMCEHHMLPFVGKAHVAYLPKNRVVGVSKLARLVDCFARRLQIQERMGEQITNAIMEHLDARAALCVIEAQHLCMKMRGVNKQNSVMITSSLKGAFRQDSALRAEVLSLIKE